MPRATARYGLESESGLSVTAYRYQPNTLAVPAPDVFEGRNSKTFFFFNTDAAKGRSLDPKTGRHAETFDLGLTNPMRGQRPFEPGSNGTLPPDWTAEGRIGRHRLIEVSTRFYGKSGATQDNVVRQIDLYAMRLSELESNELGVIAG